MSAFLSGIVRGVLPAASNGLFVLAFFFGTTSLAQGEEYYGEARNTFANAQVTWQLKNVRKASPGQEVRLKEGQHVHEYVLEADAESSQQDIFSNFSKARFRMNVDVFSPNRDMPGQTKGKWYVQGKWTLEPDVRDQGALQAGALTGAVSGRIQAELSFNPTVVNKAWQGSARIPMSRVRADSAGTGVRPLRGEGAVAFDSGSEGSLAVNLKLWPKL